MSTEPRSSALSLGMLLFPQLTQLDLTGPYEVFSRMPKGRGHFESRRRQVERGATRLGEATVPVGSVE
jgi:hypothetical protein